MVKETTDRWCRKCGCGNDARGYAHLDSCSRKTAPSDIVVQLRTRGWPPVVTEEAAAEIERLREFVQFVADASNDPHVRAEAIQLGAKR